jgi:hypothetical protein
MTIRFHRNGHSRIAHGRRGITFVIEYEGTQEELTSARLETFVDKVNASIDTAARVACDEIEGDSQAADAAARTVVDALPDPAQRAQMAARLGIEYASEPLRTGDRIIR